MKRPTEKIEEQEWIERYLRNQMTAPERIHFEDELQKDANLMIDMEQQKDAYAIMQRAFLEMQVVKTVKQLQVRQRRRTKIIAISRYLTGLAAACIILFTYFSLSPAQFPTSENDFTVVRGTDTTTMSPQQKVVFEQFFEGQAHIAEGQYLLAVHNFETVLQSEDIRPYFREAAQWHLIVSYLKSGDVARADHLYQRFVQCADCEYEVGFINRLKIRCQIWWARL